MWITQRPRKTPNRVASFGFLSGGRRHGVALQTAAVLLLPLSLQMAGYTWTCFAFRQIGRKPSVFRNQPLVPERTAEVTRMPRGCCRRRRPSSAQRLLQGVKTSITHLRIGTLAEPHVHYAGKDERAIAALEHQVIEWCSGAAALPKGSTMTPGAFKHEERAAVHVHQSL